MGLGERERKKIKRDNRGRERGREEGGRDKRENGKGKHDQS